MSSIIHTWETVNQIWSSVRPNRMLFHGPAGTGKTFFGYHLSKVENREFFSITLSEDIISQEFLFMFLPVGGGNLELSIHKCLQVWQNGGIIVFNEINRASGPVLTSLYNILDDAKMARVYLPRKSSCGKDIVKVSPNTTIICTMNSGPDELPEALVNRFQVKFNITSPNPLALETLPAEIKDFAKNYYSNSAGNTNIGFRDFQYIGNLLQKGIPAETASSVVLIDSEVITEFNRAYSLFRSAKPSLK